MTFSASFIGTVVVVSCALDTSTRNISTGIAFQSETVEVEPYITFGAWHVKGLIVSGCAEIAILDCVYTGGASCSLSSPVEGGCAGIAGVIVHITIGTIGILGSTLDTVTGLKEVLIETSSAGLISTVIIVSFTFRTSVGYVSAGIALGSIRSQVEPYSTLGALKLRGGCCIVSTLGAVIDFHEGTG